MRGIIITIFMFGMFNFTLANNFSSTEEEEEKDYTKIRDGKTLRKCIFVQWITLSEFIDFVLFLSPSIDLSNYYTEKPTTRFYYLNKKWIF